MLSRLLLYTLVLTAFIGCSEEYTETNPVSNPSKNPKNRFHILTRDYSSIANANNPYNGYGVAHNNGLDYGLASWDSTNTDTIGQMSLYAAEYIPIATDDSISISQIPALEDIATATLLYTGTLQSAYDSLGFTLLQKTFCNSIVSTIKDTSINSLSSMISALTTIENQIISNTALNDTTRALPLILAAIAKHSAYYHWHYSFNLNTSSIVQKGSSNVIMDISEKEKWKKVLEQDAVGMVFGAATGFLGGAIKGALGGLLVGGPAGGALGTAGGAIGGSLVGGVTGGVGASLVSLKMDGDGPLVLE